MFRKNRSRFDGLAEGISDAETQIQPGKKHVGRLCAIRIKPHRCEGGRRTFGVAHCHLREVLPGGTISGVPSIKMATSSISSSSRVVTAGLPHVFSASC